jgi:hypothetical protein
MRARTVSLIAFYGLVSLVCVCVGAAWLAWLGYPLYACIVAAVFVGVGHALLTIGSDKKG